MSAGRLFLDAGALSLLVLFGGSGCDTSAYCFSDCLATQSTSTGAGGNGGAGGAGFTTATGFITTGEPMCGDTQSSLDNCGSCKNQCNLLGATPACVAGKCVIAACLPGQYDIDGIPDNGCEYACPVTVLTPEQCDGLDNDCNGLIDAADPGLVAPPNICNQTPGTPCAATTIVCDANAGWTCVYPAGVETVAGFVRQVETLCDGVDGNCNGQADEWFTTLGATCDDGALGVCRDYGGIVCDAQDATKTACNLAALPVPGMAGPELCDGIDNDCNGLVDDDLPDTAFDMVTIPGSAVKVDRYEASRPDAAAAAGGINESVACSKPSVLPWTGGGFPEAKSACAARGPKYRLCTEPELAQACVGNTSTVYPYGNAYGPTTCNGVDHATPNALATGSLAQCVSSPDPIHDLSGNVAEWTSTQENAPALAPNRIFALHGGSYLSPILGLACNIALQPRAVETTLLPNIGFRCCKDP